jgi:glycosyltransferase involved in cell wall biosynthesis
VLDNFSVLICVYYKEKAEYFEQALNSILKQSIPPSEIVLVKDGLLNTELDGVIEKFAANFSCFKIVSLSKNVGLGNALHEGLKHCSFELVARMDSDDISMFNRFEIQLNFFKEHSELSVVGGFMCEFENNRNNSNRINSAPVGDNAAIRRYARFRNPLNHPTVMFKKSHVLNVGSYIEISLFEDYYLWLRLLNKNYKINNLKEILVDFRVGKDLIGRRHGFKYALKELFFFNKCRKEKLITSSVFIIQVVTRIPLRLIPKIILRNIYALLLRRKMYLNS